MTYQAEERQTLFCRAPVDVADRVNAIVAENGLSKNLTLVDLITRGLAAVEREQQRKGRKR